ncbi:MAG: TAXI family TRAP transporter solute-binding subunit [Rhizobiales bacterium]|mgnify:CR=1 FL=1|nr:TAXI family TRAP transporter solute-binding subunit [Hyphomicrobiales bacterium]
MNIWQKSGWSLAFSVLALGSASAQSLSLATGAPGGGFLDYGQHVAAVLKEKGLVIDVQQTSGTAENLKRVEAGQADCGLAVLGPAYEAWNGLGGWTGGVKMQNFRAVAPMYETTFHTIVPEGGTVRSFADLKGLKVAVGPKQGTGELMFAGILQATGVKADMANGAPNDHIVQLEKGEVQAFWFGAGLPVPAFRTAADRYPVRVLGFSEAERAAIIQRLPYLAPSNVPAGTYKGQQVAVEAVGIWNIVVCGKRVPSSAIQSFAKALFDGRPALEARMKAASMTLPANATKNQVIPYHPDLAEFYRSQGVNVRTE